ncbi:kinase-like domain-containing protein [Apiospora aurea]|uniref:EKC/KEOPS complex subunit BUD32 n=1 Tax=Apiospora aurea TaxID=335848 RepID=A0ABR1QWY8_9PEZI
MAEAEVTFSKSPHLPFQLAGQDVHIPNIANDESEEAHRRYQPLDDPDDLEDVEQYRRGGYHPVHLGDLLDDRFEVFHKLGFGSDATVWLCLDTRTQNWRAVKIMRASPSSVPTLISPYSFDEAASTCDDLRLMQHFETKGIDAEEAGRNHIIIPGESFQITGPNGTHHCFVFPVLGPSILSKLNAPETHGDLLRQVAEGMRFLHEHGVRHGDLRPQNILLRLRDDECAKDDMDLLLGLPELEKVRRAVSDVDLDLDGDRDPGPHAPRYLVRRTSLEGLGVEDEVAVVDSGGYYHSVDGDVPMHPDSSLAYAAPEVVYASTKDVASGLESDVWALGCTIAELRCGKSLLGVGRYGGGEEKYLEDLEYLLGHLPTQYRSARETLVDESAGEETQSTSSESDEQLPARQMQKRQKRDLPSQPMSMSSEELVQSRKESFSRSGRSCPIEAAISQERHWFNFPLDAEGQPDQSKDMVAFRHSMPDSEVPELGDLLRRIFKYDPGERISIEEVLQHRWFQNSVGSLRTSELRDSVSASSSPVSPKSEFPPRWKTEEEQARPEMGEMQAVPSSSNAVQTTKPTLVLDRMVIGIIIASLCWAVVLVLLALAGLRFEWVPLGQSPADMIIRSQQLLQLSNSQGQLHLPAKAMLRSPIACNCVIS